MDVVYAVGARFIPSPGGGGLLVQAGQHWPADDPLVKEHPDLFSRDARYGLNFSVDPGGMGEPPVEQVTAAPGEKRARVRRD